MIGKLGPVCAAMLAFCIAGCKETSITGLDGARFGSGVETATVVGLEGAPLSFSLQSASSPKSGSNFSCVKDCPVGLTVDATTGLVSWTPTYTQSGTYSVAFSVSEGKRSNSKTVNLNIENRNRAPTLAAVAPLSVGEGTATSFVLSGQDPDDDALTYSCLSGCPSGMTVNASTGQVSWTPSFTQAGSYAPVFQVSDGENQATRLAALTIVNFDRAVVLSDPLDATVAEGSLLSFALSATDPDSDTVTYGCVVSCPAGLVVDMNTGAVSWTPTFAQAGTYTVTLGAYAQTSASLHTVALTVLNTPSLPSLTITLPGTATYTSNSAAQTLRGTCSLAPLVLTANVTGTFSNTCSVDGTFRFSFTLSGSMAITLTATHTWGEARQATITATLDSSPPSLAITSPNSGADWITDASSVSLSGSCSTDVVSLTSSPVLSFSDFDCSDGTWALAPSSLGFERKTYTVTATKASGASLSRSIKVTKTVVLGQTSLSSRKVMSSVFSKSTSAGHWTDGTRLIVADYGNARVLIWNSMPANAGTAPDVVLGQPDIYQKTRNNGGLGPRSIDTPSVVFFDGTRLYVSDIYNRRILIWNSLPTAHFQPADVVLGQPNFYSVVCGRSATQMCYSHGIWSDGSKLVVSDFANSRVLIWNTVPTTNGAPADVVVGHPDMNTGGVRPNSQNGFWYPTGVISSGGKLIVADFNQNRVMIWNSFPTSNFASADVVLGQADFTTSLPNSGGVTSSSLSYPNDVSSDGARLYVSDRDNHRVLVWNTIPTASGTAADLVLGQSSMTTAEPQSGGLSAQSLWSPTHIMAAAGRLFVKDGSDRILSWPTAGLTNFATADAVYGRENFLTGMRSLGLKVPVSEATDVIRVGQKVVVSDYYNNRVLIWNSLPADDSVPPDIVLGQPDLFKTGVNTGGISASSLRNPWGLWSDGTRLVVGDRFNHRVLIWNTFPTANNASADLVLGQPDMTSATANNGVLSDKSLYQPAGIHSDGTRLFVADSLNHRVLIWNTFPTANFAAANVVVGQSLMTVGTANAGGTVSASTLSQPMAVTTIGTKLVITDYANHRVNIWNAIPTANFVTANVTLGQPNQTSALPNNGVASALTLQSPMGVRSDGTRLFVSDKLNNRVLVWNTVPSVTQTPANIVLGQPLFSSVSASPLSKEQSITGPNNVALGADGSLVIAESLEKIKIWQTLPTQNAAPRDTSTGNSHSHSQFVQPTSSNLSAPTGTVIVGGKLIAADIYNNRVLIWNSVPSSSNTPADVVLGQPNFGSGLPNAGGAVTNRTLYEPVGLATDGTKLFVVDQLNHRVLVFNSVPTSSYAPADLVLGQPNFTSRIANNLGLSARSLNNPRFVHTDGTRLFVTDSKNSRILIWNAMPLSDFESANVVVGQSSFTSNVPNSGGVGSGTLAINADGLWADSGRLVVADQGNNRVLIWNSIPTSNGVSADVVLGQPSSYSSTINAEGLSASSFYGPCQPIVSGGKLFVSDRFNNRILYWNTVPTSSATPADGVLGQDSFYQNSVGGVSGVRFVNPHGIFADTGHFVIPDNTRERILIMPPLQ